MRRRVSFILVLFASIITIGVGATQFMREAEAQGAILYHPSADCTGTEPTILLNWTPLAGTEDQWLEISQQDNGFEADTFTRIDLFPEETSYSMTALARDLPNYWRIVSDTASGPVASETKTFVSCGAPYLLWGPLECRGYTSATVRFHWAPVADLEGEQWIEFDSDGDWTGDDFWQAGPYSPSADTARRSGFANGVGYQFRVVREIDGERQVSSTGWFMPDCLPEVNPNIYGTDDRLIVPAINVNAPVNMRDVGFDGILGNPSGGYDVVRYNFGLFPNLYGEIGSPGAKVIGGHFDYYVIGPAIFWDLAKLRPGDMVEYWDGGVKYTYVVDWVNAVPYNSALNSLIEGSPEDSLMLVTCFGEFDRDKYGGYDQRTIVHAVRQQ